MKKKIVFFTVLFLVSFIVLGACSSNESVGEEDSTVVK
jgi:preprotein translocase subunit SecG